MTADETIKIYITFNPRQSVKTLTFAKICGITIPHEPVVEHVKPKKFYQQLNDKHNRKFMK